MVARFEERKGHNIAILAFKKLILENPQFINYQLFLIGGGHLLEKVKEFSVSQRLDKNVVFLGQRNDYLDFVVSSLFLINPSLEGEDLPYIILEAMAQGVPVIGTDVAGIPEEIENGKTGIIVPPKNPEALNQAMLNLLSDSKKRIEMGIAAKMRFEQLFTLDRMVKNYTALYNKN